MKVTILLLVLGVNSQDCQSGPLGIETDGDIKLSASDAHTEITSADYGRLNTKTGGGAWCIGQVAAGDTSQYLQIDLGKRARIDGFQLQGRHNGTEGVEKVIISVWREGTWLKVDEIEGTTGETELYKIDPIMAKSFRLTPVTSRSRPVCMRVEALGCFIEENNFRQYELSKAPTGTAERGLHQLRGHGRLTDGNMNEYLRFDADQLIIDFDWFQAINLTEIELHLQQTTSFCLKTIRLVSTHKSEVFELDCDATTGRQILPVPVNQLTNQVSIELSYSGSLFLSEVTWKTGNLSSEVTTIQLMKLCTSNPYVMPTIAVLLCLVLVWTVVKIVSRVRQSCSYNKNHDELPIYYYGESESSVSFKQQFFEKSDCDSGRGDSIYARIK